MEDIADSCVPFSGILNKLCRLKMQKDLFAFTLWAITLNPPPQTPDITPLTIIKIMDTLHNNYFGTPTFNSYSILLEKRSCLSVTDVISNSPFNNILIHLKQLHTVKLCNKWSVTLFQ